MQFYILAEAVQDSTFINRNNAIKMLIGSDKITRVLYLNT